MKGLKITLIATYVIIIILLLLSLVKCGGHDDDDPPVREKFNADVVMCIDCTGSMANLIGTIKNNALNFYPDMKRRCEEQGKKILSMRIKVIAFRDLCDSPPVAQSGFFEMPAQEDEFRNYVSALTAFGGGMDAPEVGYDALADAMDSDWDSGRNLRKAIILWTDADSKPLTGHGNIESLTREWNDDSDSRRLILFAPDFPSWRYITDSWNNSVRHDVNIGGGLSDIDYDEILTILSESI